MSAAKTWAMVVVAVLAYVYSALTDGGVDDKEWVVVAYTAVGAFGVWVVPNLDAGPGRFAKAAVAFLTAGLAALQVVIQGGLTLAEVIEVLLAAGAAIGLVAGLENKGYLFARRPGFPDPVIH